MKNNSDPHPLFYLVDLTLLSTFAVSVPGDVIEGKLEVMWLPKNN